MRLTDSQVRSLTSPEKGQKTYWEKGFGVRVSQGGSKTFVVKVEGRQHTIGRYPAISLKDARKEAMRLKVQEPPQKRLERLVAAREAYLGECETKNRPNTVRSYRLYLEQLDRTYLRDVKRSDIDLGNPHMVTAWKVFFNWCIRNEVIDRNPFAYVAAKYPSRSRVLTREEIAQVWQYTFPPYSHLVKLSILTGQRIGQWSSAILETDTVRFPADAMKNGDEHVIPATPLMIDLIDETVPFNGWSNAKKRLDKHVPLPAWRIHDLRRTFSTLSAEIGIPLHVTERILDHRSGSISGVAAIYNRHTYMREMREALTIYTDHIQSLVA